MATQVMPGYEVGDIAFVIPTYNRPDKIVVLLESIKSQGCFPGRIIVVGAGCSVEKEVLAFSESLSVDYLHSEACGQILQRNIGIDSLEGKYRLVGFLDDDLVFEPGALDAMINFWNSAEPEVAGVGFNIINEEPPAHSRLRGMFFMGSPHQGGVLVSGHAVSLVNVQESIQARWLGGGYTLWRREILEQFKQLPVETRWAIGEDVRFSYPVGKQYPMYICAEARVRHEHVFDQAPPEEVIRYRGRKWAIAQLVFADMHDELSVVACLWMLLGNVAMTLLAAARGRGDGWGAVIGKLHGVLCFFKLLLAGKDYQVMLGDGA